MFTLHRISWVAGLTALVLLGGCSSLYKADHELGMSNYTTAIPLYKDYLASHPDSADARRGMGVALMRSGQADAAIAEFNAVLAKKPKDAFSHLYLGVAQLYKGQVSEGMASMGRFDDKTQPLVGDEAKYQVNRVRNRLAGRTPSAAELQTMAREVDQAIAAAVVRQKDEDQKLREMNAGGGCGC
jgi:tetratricopeptide (TPR) repeat protein